MPTLEADALLCTNLKCASDLTESCSQQLFYGTQSRTPQALRLQKNSSLPAAGKTLPPRKVTLLIKFTANGFHSFRVKFANVY